MVEDLSIDGLILVDKPQGLTSQQAVSRVKRTLGIRRVGHGGALDPMATGLLVVAVGRATRLLGYVADKTKRYTGTIRLGQAMNTDDAEGEPQGELVDATGISTQAIREAMAQYLGRIQQVPSSVSAIKVDGRRAYDRVRAGEEVELKAREVTITSYELVERRDEAPWVDLDVVVDCSSGTYIRALARDLGRDLGVGGHLTALRRTSIGKMSIDDAVALDQVKLNDVIDMADMVHHIAASMHIDEEHMRDVAVGRTIALTLTGMTALLYYTKFVALYQPDPHDPLKAIPVAVFITSQEVTQ